MVERIELRDHRRLYGVIVGGTALIVQHGRDMLAFDLWATLEQGAPVFIERVLHPHNEQEEPVESAAEQ